LSLFVVFTGIDKLPVSSPRRGFPIKRSNQVKSNERCHSRVTDVPAVTEAHSM
jgi:hypothetical protein